MARGYSRTGAGADRVFPPFFVNMCTTGYCKKSARWICISPVYNRLKVDELIIRKAALVGETSGCATKRNCYPQNKRAYPQVMRRHAQQAEL